MFCGKRSWLTAVCFLLACRGATPPNVHDGDIVFQISRSSQSVAIQRATHSKYSHVGVILLRDGKPYVFEAAATVRFTPLDRWIAHGEDGHFVVKRLRNAIAPAAMERIKQDTRHYEGRAYDLVFEWSDDRIYCSELVWKLFERAAGVKIGELKKLRDFDLTDPAVKQKLHERYGDRIPLDEPVIPPSTMFESDLLVTVAER